MGITFLIYKKNNMMKAKNVDTGECIQGSHFFQNIIPNSRFSQDFWSKKFMVFSAKFHVLSYKF